jgi:hypothetical protein
MENIRKRIYAAVAGIKDEKKLKIILQFILGIKGG